ncbi:MAG: MoxR family ATPase [Candidatus Methanomethylicus sp.]|nr:MoxR family ATPase [Candidatus Methanomethylicus sp.]
MKSYEGNIVSLEDVQKIQQKYKIIGRTEELQEALLAVCAKKHTLIEGSVGVGKTVVAIALANHFNRNIYRVDGDERYTEQKMVGWFDPPLVMSKGYSKEAFIEGPLYKAMVEGAFLFINELNRMPEGTQNVLLPAMDERKIVVPRIGTVIAKDGFTIIATQNPEEYIGTSRLSEALKDRFVWIRLDYQSEEEEGLIVKKETCSQDDLLVKLAVKIARRTRENPEIRRGASVRGAIDLVSIICQATSKPIQEQGAVERKRLIEKSTIMALSSKVEQREGSHEKLIEMLTRIADDVLIELKLALGTATEQVTKEHSENF